MEQGTKVVGARAVFCVFGVELAGVGERCRVSSRYRLLVGVDGISGWTAYMSDKAKVPLAA
jgi:hypothetical protein